MSGWNKKRIPIQFADGFQWQGNSVVQEDFFEVSPERGVFLLADGFGGSPGRKAAEIAVKATRQFLEQEAGDLDATLPFELRPYYSLAGNVLFNAIAFANQNVLRFNQDRSSLDSGGASLLAGYIDGNLLALANVGANRLFLKRDQKVKQIVAPRSLLSQANPMADEGEGDQVPLMSLGTSKSLEPEIIEIELKPGDQIFMQTSGMKELSRSQLLRLNHPNELRQIFDELVMPTNASLLWLGF